jgi:hypothetical protein
VIKKGAGTADEQKKLGIRVFLIMHYGSSIVKINFIRNKFMCGSRFLIALNRIDH